MPVLPPTPDARAAPKGHRQHDASPSAVRHRLLPHWPGIFDDLFADTKTLRLPPQALGNAMNHSTDTDARTHRDETRHGAPMHLASIPANTTNAPYGSPTPPTASAPPPVHIVSSFSLFPFAVTLPTILMPPTARQRPLRPRHPPPLPLSEFWFMALRDARPGPVVSLSVGLLVAGCSCLSSTPVAHGRSVLQLLAGPPFSRPPRPLSVALQARAL